MAEIDKNNDEVIQEENSKKDDIGTKSSNVVTTEVTQETRNQTREGATAARSRNISTANRYKIQEIIVDKTKPSTVVKEFERNMRKHNQQLESIQSRPTPVGVPNTLMNKNSKVFDLNHSQVRSYHASHKVIHQRAQASRQVEIERENQKLLKKLVEINAGASRHSAHPAAIRIPKLPDDYKIQQPRSNSLAAAASSDGRPFHFNARKAELQRIERENQKIAKKIFTLKSGLEASNFAGHYKNHLNVRNNLTKLKKKKMPVLNGRQGYLPPIDQVDQLRQGSRQTDLERQRNNSAQAHYNKLSQSVITKKVTSQQDNASPLPTDSVDSKPKLDTIASAEVV